MSVASTIRDHLMQASVATTSTASLATTSFFLGPLPKAGNGVPAECVSVLVSGGPPPNEFMADGVGTYRRHRVGVWVRGRPNGYLRTNAIAEQCWKALQAANLSGIVRVVATASSPVYYGQTDLENDLFECPFLVETKG
jgi:hypothetical protein